MASVSAARTTTGARSSGRGSAAPPARLSAAATCGASGATAEMPPFWEIGCVGVEVSVNEATGEIRVERLVTVGDIGCAINPQTAEAQDVGAAMMGLGMATREELVYRDGNLLNGNLFDYRVPRTTNLPELRTVLVERGDGVGVYGAKGGGEGALNPVAAAIANAVERAAGIRLREAPFTPERVWRALQARDAARAATGPASTDGPRADHAGPGQPAASADGDS